MSESSEQLALPLVDNLEMPAPKSTETGLAISRDAINALAIRSYQGPVAVIDNDDDMKRAIAEIREEELLGFDTETKPVFHAGVSHPPALVQLAGAKQAWIFQLRYLTRLHDLYAILSERSITKAGVALADDLKKLKELREFKPAGFAEIGDTARRLGYTQTGLRTLAGLILGFRISKREQRSNWARRHLKPSQITYAATDAWVSRELHIALAQQLASQD